jgi:hypothetical protein
VVRSCCAAPCQLHPATLLAAGATGFAKIHILLAWDEQAKPRRSVGFWALQERRNSLWTPAHLEAGVHSELRYNYTFTSNAEFAADDRRPHAILIGWRGYFGFCQTPRVLTNLEAWIRRRLRLYLWRQWRNGHNRFTELRRFGIAKFAASVAAGSPTGLWRMSGHPAVHALRNHVSTLLVSPESSCLCRLNSIEPPWYGPVCPVVWEGWRRETSPYPDQSPRFKTVEFCSSALTASHALSNASARRWKLVQHCLDGRQIAAKLSAIVQLDFVTGEQTSPPDSLHDEAVELSSEDFVSLAESGWG